VTYLEAEMGLGLDMTKAKLAIHTVLDFTPICHLCGESDCKTPDACFEVDDPCDRCGKSCGAGIHEAPDGGYICASCFMDDVTRAEYMSEGDR